MRKYRTYIITLVVLSAIAVYYRITDKKSTVKITNNYFAITDTSIISGIRIVKNSDTLLLLKRNDNWIVNNTFNARNRLVNQLLGLLSQVEVYTPAPKQLKNDLIRSYSENPLIVNFFSREKILKTYKIVESDSILHATIIFTEEQNDPYIIKIPGFEGRISMLFQTNPLLFRDKTIFRYQPYEILFAKIEYPKSPDKSYLINTSNPKEIIIQSVQTGQHFKISKEHAIQYLLNFSNVPFDFVKPGKSHTISDSLKNLEPNCIIHIKDIANQEIEVKTYPITVKSKNHSFDLFKMYAVIQNDSLPVEVKYSDFDPITKEYKSFLSK